MTKWVWVLLGDRKWDVCYKGLNYVKPIEREKKKTVHRRKIEDDVMKGLFSLFILRVGKRTCFFVCAYMLIEIC